MSSDRLTSLLDAAIGEELEERRQLRALLEQLSADVRSATDAIRAAAAGIGSVVEVADQLRAEHEQAAGRNQEATTAIAATLDGVAAALAAMSGTVESLGRDLPARLSSELSRLPGALADQVQAIEGVVRAVVGEAAPAGPAVASPAAGDSTESVVAAVTSALGATSDADEPVGGAPEPDPVVEVAAEDGDDDATDDGAAEEGDDDATDDEDEPAVEIVDVEEVPDPDPAAGGEDAAPTGGQARPAGRRRNPGRR